MKHKEPWRILSVEAIGMENFCRVHAETIEPVHPRSEHVRKGQLDGCVRNSGGFLL